ncbi:MAG: SDR family oxidoreductase [Candidatus Eremiobacteraeota bacterium]|nr:SDR family oxidoreductase [Candidatus Eremiobacteraeota bacterium]MBC5828341.1 SDR family oxidoreductase [Candidatus Eremiobacteraeota bacterium]
MRVLITGAAGFIGSHLVDRYLNDGWNVVGMDNLLTGDMENLIAAGGHPCFSFVHCDISAPWPASISDSGGIDLVLHFASPASPVDYARYPLETMRVNSIGTQNCCEAALTWGAQFLYASTSETYGEPLQHPQSESYWGNVNPIGPRSCYDEAKRFGEALVMAYWRSNGLPGRIIRIFNTYGPRMRRSDGRVVPNFIAQALGGAALTIFGDGRQTRSFCYVDDLVEGIVRCADSSATTGVIVNLGNPKERTILDFAHTVSDIAAVPLRVEARPMPQDDPSRRCPDISRAKELLGWEPRVSLEDGLRRTIDSFAKAGNE